MLDKYDIVVALNQQSLDKFAPRVKAGGTLIYDTNGIHNHPTRDDISIHPIDAMTATLEIGNSKAYNMVVLGALLGIRDLVPLDAVMRGLKKTLPERHHHLLSMNEEAIQLGMTLVNEK